MCSVLGSVLLWSTSDFLISHPSVYTLYICTLCESLPFFLLPSSCLLTPFQSFLPLVQGGQVDLEPKALFLHHPSLGVLPETFFLIFQGLRASQKSL